MEGFKGALEELTERYMEKGPMAPMDEHSVFGFRFWEWLQKVLLENTASGEVMPGRGERERVRELVSRALHETMDLFERTFGKDTRNWA